MEILKRITFTLALLVASPAFAAGEGDLFMRAVPVSLRVGAGVLFAEQVGSGPRVTTGTPTFSRVFLGDGTAAAPSLTFASDTTKGIFSPGTNEVGIATQGIHRFDFDTTHFTVGSTGTIRWSSTTDPRAASDLILSRESAAVLQLGVDAAGVTNQLFKGPDRITSDGVGGNLTFAGGRNRGASVGGSLIFQTSPAAGAGVTGTLGTVLTLSPTALTITTIVVPASSGTRFLCIDTNGVVTSSASACSGT